MTTSAAVTKIVRSSPAGPLLALSGAAKGARLRITALVAATTPYLVGRIPTRGG